MTIPNEATYVIEDRVWIVETPDVRVQILTLGSGQEVPWHSHTAVTDTFTCLDGDGGENPGHRRGARIAGR